MASQKDSGDRGNKENAKGYASNKGMSIDKKKAKHLEGREMNGDRGYKKHTGHG